MYILIPFLHSWKNGAVQPWHSSSEVMGLRLCSLLLSLDEPACLLGSCTAQTQTLLRFPWHKGRLIQRAAPWDGTVQPRRSGRTGWVALLPQYPAQSASVAGHRVQSGYTPVPLSLPRSGLMLEPELQHPNFTGIANPVPLLPFCFCFQSCSILC